VTTAGYDVLDVRDRLAAEGLLTTMVAGKIRMLTHVDVDDAGIEAALEAWRRVVASLPATRHEEVP
jgi:hypothetical protein